VYSLLRFQFVFITHDNGFLTISGLPRNSLAVSRIYLSQFYKLPIVFQLPFMRIYCASGRVLYVIKFNVLFIQFLCGRDLFHLKGNERGFKYILLNISFLNES
jgi:hypothetical protein